MGVGRGGAIGTGWVRIVGDSLAFDSAEKYQLARAGYESVRFLS